MLPNSVNDSPTCLGRGDADQFAQVQSLLDHFSNALLHPSARDLLQASQETEIFGH